MVGVWDLGLVYDWDPALRACSELGERVGFRDTVGLVWLAALLVQWGSFCGRDGNRVGLDESPVQNTIAARGKENRKRRGARAQGEGGVEFISLT